MEHLWGGRDGRQLVQTVVAAAQAEAEEQREACHRKKQAAGSAQQSPQKRKAAAQAAVRGRLARGQDPRPLPEGDEGGAGDGSGSEDDGEEASPSKAPRKSPSQRSPPKAGKPAACSGATGASSAGPGTAAAPAAGEGLGVVSPTRGISKGLRQMRLFGGDDGGMGMRHASQEEAALLDGKKKGRARRKPTRGKGSVDIALLFQKASQQRQQQPQQEQQQQRKQQEAAPRLAELDAEVQAGVLQRLYVELCKRHDPGQYVAQGLQEKPGLLSQVDQQQVKRVRQLIENWKRRGYRPQDFSPSIERRVWDARRTRGGRMWWTAATRWPWW